MRDSYRLRHVAITSVIIFFAFAFASCAHVQIEDLSSSNLSHYKYEKQSAGLRFSMDPYTEKYRLNKFFGCDLLSRGILPVFVVVRNVNAEDGYLLLKNKARLVINNPAHGVKEGLHNRGNLQAHEAYETEKASNNLLGPSLLIGPIATIPVILLAAFSANKLENEITIVRNMENKQIEEETLYAGSSQRGFLYFKVRSRRDVKDVEGIRLYMKDIRSGQAMSVLINIGDQVK